MESIANFFDQNMVVVFFFYGLAFFSMGLAVWMEAGRSPDFSGARAMLFLAGFGLLHGIHEWLEVFTILQWADTAVPSQMVILELARVALLAVSFLFLIMYGLRLIFANQGRGDAGRRSLIWTAVFGAAWLAAAATYYLINRPCGVECIVTADVLSRYMLAIPGALLAAWAMLQQRGSFKARGMPTSARDFAVAAAALFLYGVLGQIFTRSSTIFPSTVINGELFRDVFGFPVQLFRGIMAAVIAIFVIRTLRAVEEERRQRFAQANEARLEAQQEALATQKQAQKETEELNHELQTAVQDLEMLFDLSRSLAKTLDRETMLEQAMKQIFDNVPRIQGGMIMLREQTGGPLEIMARAGYEQQPGNGSGSEEAIERAAIVGQEVVIRNDSLCWTGAELISTKLCPCSTGEVGRALDLPKDKNLTIGMPIIVQDDYAGSLVLSVDGDSEWLTPHDLALIRTAASQLSMAVSNAMLYEQVQAREELRGELLQQVTLAEEQERQRIARELHDCVGQRATALGLGLAAASETISKNPALGQKQLGELREMSGQLVLELQRLISGLRPSLLDDLGLVPAIRGQLRQLEQQAGVATRFAIDGDERRLEPQVETTVFRIAQEALHNVAKHAHASFVLVRLSYGENDIKLMIEDDGRGFNLEEVGLTDPDRRWGLLGIRERVELVGGDYDVVSAVGKGTTLSVRFPMVAVKLTVDGTGV